MSTDDYALIQDLQMVHQRVFDNQQIVADGNRDVCGRAADRIAELIKPIPMRIHCPECGELHIDKGEFATKVHHTHACQHCGAVFRPAVVPTVGVRFLPGFKDD